MPLTLQTVRNTLKSAVTQRSIWYTQTYGLTIRWEADPGATVDTTNFQAILQTLQLSMAQELVISASDETPGSTVQTTFREMLRKANADEGKSLVIVHYAGQEVAESTMLAATPHENSTQFDADEDLISPAMPPDSEDGSNVDVLFLFDCCYISNITRHSTLSPRVVEIISSTEAITDRFPRYSLSGRLATEIATRLRKGHSNIEFAELAQTLRYHSASSPDPGPKPNHSIKLGASSICLPCSGLVGVDPGALPPPLHAVFSIRVDEYRSGPEFYVLAEWAEKQSRSVDMSLEGVYPTETGRVMVVSSAWAVYSKLEGLDGYALIAEAVGPRVYPGL